MSKKSASFISKLSGRLTLLEHTAAVTTEVAHTAISSKYGKRLASLVENGNQDAINLLRILSERDQIISEGKLDFEYLESYNEPINVLCERLNLDINQDFNNDLTSMLRLATSMGRFESARHFKEHLCEGLILNVTVLASKALSIPYGEYVVTATDSNQTMLVPTNEAVETNAEVFEDVEDNLELHTQDLIKCWNKVERVLEEKRKYKTGRPALKSAVSAAGGVTAAAEKTGLSVSTISNDINNNSPIGFKAQEKYMKRLKVDPRAFHRTGKVAPYHDLSKSEPAPKSKKKKKKTAKAKK